MLSSYQVPVQIKGVTDGHPEITAPGSVKLPKPFRICSLKYIAFAQPPISRFCALKIPWAVSIVRSAT